MILIWELRIFETISYFFKFFGYILVEVDHLVFEMFFLDLQRDESVEVLHDKPSF
jgi:hypothetical protein